MTKRRWLKSVIAASQEPQAALPFQRGNRTRPDAMQPAGSATAKQVAVGGN